MGHADLKYKRYFNCGANHLRIVQGRPEPFPAAARLAHTAKIEEICEFAHLIGPGRHVTIEAHELRRIPAVETRH